MKEFKNNNIVIILILSIFSALLLLYIFSNYIAVGQTAKDFALKGKTTTIYEEYQNIKINSTIYDINNSNLIEINKNNNSIIISFGNSQSHSINDYHNNTDHLFSYHLNSMNKDNIILNLSAPNGSMQEMFLALVNSKSKLKSKFTVAIFSLVFDDTRENGIRDEMNSLLIQNKLILQKYLTGKTILTSIKQDTNKQNNINKILIKDDMEIIINKYLNNISDSYKNRGNIRSYFYGELYYIRNWVLNINPSSKRKKIQRLYKKNMQALSDIINFCKNNNIKPILYIAPIRQDIEIPYVQKEYLQFKIDVDSIYSVYDLDNIIPTIYWGKTKGDWVDFMHFKGEGHKILASELHKILLKEVEVK